MMYPQEYYDAIAEFRLMDDTFMSAVFDRDTLSLNLLLNIILNRSDMETIDVKTQVSYSNLIDRSIRLDVEAKDSSGKLYNIEVQNRSDEANVRRARYHSSMIDTKLLKRGEDFSALVDSYVIFITEQDVLGRNLPLYEIDRVVKQTGAAFGDGSHIIYVNASIDSEDTPLSKLMHDFKCKDPSEMYYSQLASRVETKGDEVDYLLLAENFKFPVASYGLVEEEPQVTLMVETRVSSGQVNKTHTRTMRIDCIILKPHEE